MTGGRGDRERGVTGWGFHAAGWLLLAVRSGPSCVSLRGILMAKLSWTWDTFWTELMKISRHFVLIREEDLSKFFSRMACVSKQKKNVFNQKNAMQFSNWSWEQFRLCQLHHQLFNLFQAKYWLCQQLNVLIVTLFFHSILDLGTLINSILWMLSKTWWNVHQ